MRLTLLAPCMVAALLASAAAFAVKPAAQLPSGALVDLNTGRVTTAGGGHYQLSATRLRQLRAETFAGNKHGASQQVENGQKHERADDREQAQ